MRCQSCYSRGVDLLKKLYYNIAQKGVTNEPIAVRVIDTGDLARYVVARFKKGKRLIDENTAAELVRYADSVTGEVQHLCEAIWDTTETGATISLDNINAAFELVFAREYESCGDSVRQLTPLQTSVMRAIAETNGLKMLSEEFMAMVGTSSIGALRAALARLVNKRLIYQYGGEYKFTNPFFREWIRRKM